MRKALISAAVVSAHEDGGIRLARTAEETGAATCDILAPGSEKSGEILRQYDIIIIEGPPPSVSLAGINRPLLFIGAYAGKRPAWLKNLPCASGILAPDPDSETLAAALLSLKAGLSVFGGENSEPEKGGPGTLSERESAVLDFFSRGFSNRDIAAYLGISINTVKYHTASVYSKLGVSTRAEAVSEGIRLGLIPI